MSNNNKKWNREEINDYEDYYDNLYNNLTVPEAFISMNVHKNRNPESDRNLLPNKRSEKVGDELQNNIDQNQHNQTNEYVWKERGNANINKNDVKNENISLYKGNEKYGDKYQKNIEKHEYKQANENEDETANNNANTGGDSEGKDVLQNSDSITKSGTIMLKDGKHTIHCMTIIGQIEGHYLLPDSQKSTKYEHVLPHLVAAEESTEIEGLLILINTVGGDIEAGLAIAEMIASMKKPTVSVVLGGGHSIGVPLAVSAKHSFIVPSAIMTLHPVRMTGLMIGAPQTYFYLNRMQDRIIRFISEHSSISTDRLRSLIMKTDELASDMGSIVEGKEAVKEGLICEVGGLSDALNYLKSEIDKNRANNKE